VVRLVTEVKVWRPWPSGLRGLTAPLSDEVGVAASVPNCDGAGPGRQTLPIRSLLHQFSNLRLKLLNLTAGRNRMKFAI
jgi:hypothetical protein